MIEYGLTRISCRNQDLPTSRRNAAPDRETCLKYRRRQTAKNVKFKKVLNPLLRKLSEGYSLALICERTATGPAADGP